MVTSSNKIHSNIKLSFCGTVWTRLLRNPATSSCPGHEENELPHQGVGVSYMSVLGTSLQIKLRLTSSGVKRCVFAGTVSARGLQLDKKCTHNINFSQKSVTVK